MMALEIRDPRPLKGSPISGFKGWSKVIPAFFITTNAQELDVQKQYLHKTSAKCFGLDVQDLGFKHGSGVVNLLNN